MEDEKKAVQKPNAISHQGFPKERTAFKSLLLTNPNYFGNLANSPFPVVFPISGNTFYEELGCVGYQPQQERLEGVVYIKQSSGYGTDICGPGTPEYLRFYLSFDNGTTWQDQGITSFQAYDILQGTEGAKRLEYAVSLKVDPKQRFCLFNPLIKVRAILSWSAPPPTNQPNWPPVWGNVLEANVLVEPIRFFPPFDLFEELKIKFPPELKDVLDLETPIVSKLKTLSLNELSTMYKQNDVPVHRFAFKELAAFATSKTSLNAELFLTTLPDDLKIDPNIFDKLFPKTDGDISFEELKCIGLDPNSPNTLVGVIQVKKSAGYSGGPCTDGSKEHVTFWGDFDGNGSFETCLGTASVRVYDVNVPQGGIYYAVRLPVDLDQYRQDCHKGPKIVRIRAILSWNSAIPCANPNQFPTWGNREETLINIGPVAGAPAGKIAILGGIPVAHIDNGTGLTTATAVFATNNIPPDSLGRPCPFGGRVTVKGSPLLGHSYKVEVTPASGGAPMAVVTNLILTRFDGTTFTHTANPITGRFTYLPFTENVNSVLAQWDSAGDAKWEVKLLTFDGGGNLIGTDTHMVQLDNTVPDASITITIGAGDCGKFTIGTVLSGSFVARDDNLGSYNLGIEPAVNDPGEGIPTPSSGFVNTAVSPGDAWSLDTTSMRSCGYIIRVIATDRAIVNSQSVGHPAMDSAGFCLVEPE